MKSYKSNLNFTSDSGDGISDHLSIWWVGWGSSLLGGFFSINHFPGLKNSMKICLSWAECKCCI